MNLLNMLLSTMVSDSSVNALAKKTGAKNSQITKLIIMALPIIIKALTKNTSSASGVTSLLGALTQHTSKKTISQQITEADAQDGAAILNHILGANTPSVTNGLAQQTGLSDDQVQTTLNNIAPAILSGLSAATSQAQNAKPAAGAVDLSDGLDLSDLMGMFMGAQQQAPQQQAKPSGGLLSSILGSLLGTNKKKPQVQAQPKPTGVDAMSMLAGLMGAGEASGSAATPQSTAGMLSSLFGASSGSAGGGLTDLIGDGDDDASFNGASLLAALLKQ